MKSKKWVVNFCRSTQRFRVLTIYDAQARRMEAFDKASHAYALCAKLNMQREAQRSFPFLEVTI